MAFLTLTGFGCKSQPEYVPAPKTPFFQVPASPEGGKASTGGESATITPPLATNLLVQALPPATDEWGAGEPVESLNPAPLPDGTRTEYVTVTRVYSNGDEKTVSLSLTDTRGIPAVYAFLDSYAERSDEAGFRRAVKVGDLDGWVNFAYGPNREADGSGSLFLLFNERFLIQLDGGVGVTPDMLTSLASRFNFDALR